MPADDRARSRTRPCVQEIDGRRQVISRFGYCPSARPKTAQSEQICVGGERRRCSRRAACQPACSGGSRNGVRLGVVALGAGRRRLGALAAQGHALVLAPDSCSGLFITCRPRKRPSGPGSRCQRAWRVFRWYRFAHTLSVSRPTRIVRLNTATEMCAFSSPEILGLKWPLRNTRYRWITVALAEMKKGAEAPFFTDLQTSVRSVNHYLERETSLELATSTLARLRSTN